MYLDYLDEHERSFREIIEFNSRNALADSTRNIEITTGIMSRVNTLNPN